MADYADSLVERHNDDTTFFYASPAESFRADGEMHRTSDMEEAYKLLDFYSKQGNRSSIIVGAMPFHAGGNAQFILPQHIMRAASTSPFSRRTTSVTMGARVVAQHPLPEKFMDNVDRALTLFKTTPLRKVVLSRMIELATDHDIDINALLFNLLTSNRLGRIFFMANAHEDTRAMLVGASPEVIISKRGLTIQSNPLAGSIARSVCPAEDYVRGQALLKSEKDVHEHALTVGSIESILRPFCSVLHVPERPSLISTPKMWHLSTHIRGVLKSHKTDSLTIARALHPTPAVCGYPTELARESIQALEGYDREWYAGMIGWMNHEGDGEWALTIRCAKIIGQSICLYAGAGIVQGSVPQKELAETYAKFGTLLDALGIALQ